MRKVPFNYIAFTKSYIKSDMHATRLLGKPLDKFKLIWNMYNLQLDLNNKKIKVGERDSVP